VSVYEYVRIMSVRVWTYVWFMCGVIRKMAECAGRMMSEQWLLSSEARQRVRECVSV
jgi:hypothetical protein